MSTTMSSEKAWGRRENRRWTVLDTVMETKVIEDAVRLACRAPSLYNTQPWLWVADGGRLDLFLDPAVSCTRIDRRGRPISAAAR